MRLLETWSIRASHDLSYIAHNPRRRADTGEEAGKMYGELCKLVYQPTVPVQRILWEHAVMMVDNAARLGLRPHGGGGVEEHYAGKIGEACFEYYLHENGLYYVPCCRGLFEDGNGHVDYLVFNGSVFKSFDVKSGLLPAHMEFQEVPLDRYGLTVPVIQARHHSVDAYAHCFIKMVDGAPRAMFAGWAYTWEVLDAPVYEGRGGRPNYYCLPVKKLRHPRELVETYRLAVEE